MNKVSYGCFEADLEVDGHTVGFLRRKLKKCMDIPDEAAAHVSFKSGSPLGYVGDGCLLWEGDAVEFIKPPGRKTGPVNGYPPQPRSEATHP